MVVKVTLDNTAQEALKDNLKFDAKKLQEKSKARWMHASCWQKRIRPMQCT
ncbi:hypothetical protein C7S14_1678 [Burkholderia cepacia]|nr:hypothetical protein C7S14_1678 [Burkholderia cepacia]